MFNSVQDLSLYYNAEDQWVPEITASNEEVLHKMTEEISMTSLQAQAICFLSYQKSSLMTTLVMSLMRACIAQAN